MDPDRIGFSRASHGLFQILKPKQPKGGPSLWILVREAHPTLPTAVQPPPCHALMVIFQRRKASGSRPGPSIFPALANRTTPASVISAFLRLHGKSRARISVPSRFTFLPPICRSSMLFFLSPVCYPRQRGIASLPRMLVDLSRSTCSPVSTVDPPQRSSCPWEDS